MIVRKIDDRLRLHIVSRGSLDQEDHIQVNQVDRLQTPAYQDDLKVIIHLRLLMDLPGPALKLIDGKKYASGVNERVMDRSLDPTTVDTERRVSGVVIRMEETVIPEI